MNPKADPASPAERAPIPRTDPADILMIHGGALGDGILGLPAVFSVRRAFPRATITLIGHPERWTWIRPSPVDRILPLERISLHRLFLPEGPFPPALASLLGEQDLVISWYGDDVFGKNLQSLVRGALLFNPFRPAALTVHASRFFLETLDPLGIPFPAAVPALEAPLPPEAAPEGGPLAVFHPGSGSRNKCWPPEHFLRLAGAVERRLGLSCRYLMGEADRWIAGHPGFRAAAADGAVLRDLPLGRVASVLKQARVYVGNDSGISHMAAALGVPSIVLFLTTNPGIWRPTGDHVRILYSPSAGIGVEDVVPEIMKILS